MAICLEHPFRNNCDIHQLLDDCYKISTFCYRLEQQAAANKQRFDENKFKGDGLECLVEFMLKYMGTAGNICIQDYRIVESDDDTGVDGHGIQTHNKRPMTVQVKYRHTGYILTANKDHLSNFLGASQNKYGVSNDDCNNMLIITTAAGINEHTANNMLYGKVRTIAHKDLKKLLDNNNGFWDDFKESMLGSRASGDPVPMIQLRAHQQEAVDAVLNSINRNQSGRVTLPTGTGKTWVQAAAIAERIRDGDKTFAVFSPRILLSFQLLREVATYLQSAGIDAEYLNVNSGRFPEDEVNEARLRAGFQSSQIRSTTSTDEIADAVKSAHDRGKPIIISSTYHSADQLNKITIDLQLNDEAHHLVSEEFNQFSNLGRLSFSFTATPKVTDNEYGLGMQNPKFGEEIFKRTPREMIDAGEMLAPALHIISGGGKHSNHHEEIFSCISDAFRFHSRELTRKSRLPDEIGAKMLVALDGQETLRGVLESNELKQFQIFNPDVSIIAMSTDVGIYIDGDWQTGSSSKRKVFEKLRTLENTERAIIMYVDMLGEGIDVPGITAFMPIRGMCDSKFVQGVGRACRLFSTDRQRLYDGVMQPSEAACYVKPHAYVIVPDLAVNCDDHNERYRNILYTLCDEYGLSAEHIIIDRRGNAEDEDDLELIDDSDKGKKRIELADITQFYHSIKEDLDRELNIHDLAWIELYNRDLLTGRDGQYFNIAATLYHKVPDWFVEDIDIYVDRAKRRHGKTDYITMVQKMRKSQVGAFNDEIRKTFGTIYTPDFVVDKTLDLAFKYIKGDPLELTWCDPACYSDDTRVMTNCGWKLFKDLDDDDLIYSLNPDTGVGEYVNFVARQIKDYNGIMHNYCGKRIDLFVTPDHQMFVQSRLLGRNNNRIINSEELAKSNRRGNTVALVSAAPLGDHQDVDGWTEHHYKLFGFWLGDGYLFKNNRRTPNAIGFGVKKQYKIDYIINCLDNLGFDYTTGVGEDGKRWFRIVNAEFLKILIPLDGTNNKRIPNDILYSSKRMLTALLDGLITSDGCKKTSNCSNGLNRQMNVMNFNETFYSSNKMLAMDVQRAMIHAGLTTYYTSRNRTRWGKNCDLHEVSSSHKNRKKLPARCVRNVPYNGKVYCVTLVKNHILLVQRNGKTAFCGNCGDGNFLINLYHRLMKCPSSMSPVAKSEHILTHCLHGVEILRNMAYACKIRLITAHLQTAKDNGQLEKGFCDLIDRLNIHHGNTIMVPEDVGKWTLSDQEGGLLDEAIRDRKYDVIIGNPPYTHLRNLENRRYHTYPKQRDMAQVFVRWALDHGDVISFNTTDAWLRFKTADGAKETRQLLFGKIREILADDEINSYSQNDGGNINTFIICMSNEKSEAFVVGKHVGSYDNINNATFEFYRVEKKYKSIRSNKTVHQKITHIKFDIEIAKRWNSNLVDDTGTGNWYLMGPQATTTSCKSPLKAVRTGNPCKYLVDNYSGQPKYIDFDNKEECILFLSFMCTKVGVEELKSKAQPNNDSWRIATNNWKTCDFPDFDYYKENRPEQFDAYMTWIEENMADKDKFLDGIDEQFEKLISE